MVWFFGIISFILLALLIVAIWFLWKFVRIILVFEDDLSDAIESLQEVERSMVNVLELKLFFDDEQIRNLVGEIMDSVKMAQFNINQMIKKFTQRSKRKYIIIMEEDEENNTHVAGPSEQQQHFGGEIPPAVSKEGTIAHVERIK